MAPTVRPIEAKAIHLIQSGQVIVDLCSVVKELVENSLDAEATTIEVRFKNNGLDEIEVQDNGTGVSPSSYESIALKHHTSKLSTFDDLATLSTFGFRGEALSSLCALADFTITTAQAHEVPKGTHLEFEPSGKLKSTLVVACQKGTTASVTSLFQNLPVRRKELTKNIKREYGKVLGLLQAYACISTQVKLIVKNTMPKTKTVTAFATQSNATTRDNIANVYGAKTLSALVELNLNLKYQVDMSQSQSMQVVVKGHISRPVFGEGRQTPDRQMFFVNGRPCGLPQIAKAINEVYRSFNVSQSPFIFADFHLDTTAYDVNVSPDKRSIFLHNATALTESLRTELTSIFDDHEQTVPQSQLRTPRLPAYKQLNMHREATDGAESSDELGGSSHDLATSEKADSYNREQHQPNGLLKDYFNGVTTPRRELTNTKTQSREGQKLPGAAHTASRADRVKSNLIDLDHSVEREDDENVLEDDVPDERTIDRSSIHVRDFNARMAEQQPRARKRSIASTENTSSTQSIPHVSGNLAPDGLVQNALDRMRPKRARPEMATISIGDTTITKMIGGNRRDEADVFRSVRRDPNNAVKSASSQQFSQRIGRFAAFGAQVEESHAIDEIDEVEEPSLQDSEPTQDQSDREAEADTDEDVDGSASKARTHLQHSPQPDAESADKSDEARLEEERVAQLIMQAEESAFKAEKDRDRRMAQALKSKGYRDTLATLQITLEDPLDTVMEGLEEQRLVRKLEVQGDSRANGEDESSYDNDEERLSLTVAKSDFGKMHIVGQFNLGFILAIRHGSTRNDRASNPRVKRDELFIIDQHASDEKFNFERLQAETVVSNQRMVRPVTLDLTAVEEEILIDNEEALEKNGFVVDVDTTGTRTVGQRCQLISLPVSKEVVFNTRDLDELIHLLSESPVLSDSRFVPRPSKVRKMFAMRACRSSIMIGKTLSRKQMSTVLQHLGSIDKPWNCPHGRPTMRHLASLDDLDSALWHEGDGICIGQDAAPGSAESDVWKAYMG